MLRQTKCMRTKNGTGDTERQMCWMDMIHIQTVNLVQKKLNPALEVEGVVFTMYDSRTNLSLEVVENVKEHLNENIYKTIIPRNVRLAEAPSYGMPINLYDSRSSGAESYRLLAAEVISRGEEL